MPAVQSWQRVAAVLLSPLTEISSPSRSATSSPPPCDSQLSTLATSLLTIAPATAPSFPNQTRQIREPLLFVGFRFFPIA
jgi:hypothetical protein